MTDQTTNPRPTPRWKCGNEYLPFHRSASHVNQDYRDGWNDCYEAGRTAARDAYVIELLVSAGLVTRETVQEAEAIADRVADELKGRQ